MTQSEYAKAMIVLFNFVAGLICLVGGIIFIFVLYDLIWYHGWGYPWWAAMLMPAEIIFVLFLRAVAVRFLKRYQAD